MVSVWGIPLQNNVIWRCGDPCSHELTADGLLAQDLHEIKEASTPCGEGKGLRRPHT